MLQLVVVYFTLKETVLLVLLFLAYNVPFLNVLQFLVCAVLLLFYLDIPADDTESDVVTGEDDTTVPLEMRIQPENLTQHVSDHYEDRIFSVAAAEGFRPVSLFDKEATAFPTLFPNGENTFEEN